MADLDQPSFGWRVIECPPNASLEPDDWKYVVFEYQCPVEIAIHDNLADGAVRRAAGLPGHHFVCYSLIDQLLGCESGEPLDRDRESSGTAPEFGKPVRTRIKIDHEGLKFHQFHR